MWYLCTLRSVKLFILRNSYTTHMKWQTEDIEQTNHKHTHLLNGLSLRPLLLFESFFLGPPLWCRCGFHCQKVKGHPFVSLGRQRQTVSGGSLMNRLRNYKQPPTTANDQTCLTLSSQLFKPLPIHLRNIIQQIIVDCWNCGIAYILILNRNRKTSQ